jgi:serine/threonine protein phosphatase 1
VGLRVYAIGDIHGRLDLLDALLQRIASDGTTAGDGIRYIVFLGDYIDRGPQSCGVIERLAGDPPPGFGAIFLKGNHEDSMIQFLSDTRVGPNWLQFGGAATLESYGITVSPEGPPGEWLRTLQARLHAALPPRHRSFLAGLRTRVAIGDYLFVHAGIRPGVALDRQQELDLLWIREEFLTSRADHGKVVVHGHTITPAPDLRANRIGIDTGAYATNRLTCLVLEGTRRRIIQT